MSTELLEVVDSLTRSDSQYHLHSAIGTHNLPQFSNVGCFADIGDSDRFVPSLDGLLDKNDIL
jgi:hypothetical protein